MNEAFDKNNSVVRIVVICLALFATLGMLWGVWLFSYSKEEVWGRFYQQILQWVTVPQISNSFLSRPWTIFTYAFADSNFISVFPNLFWLWTFGYILQDVGGNKKVIPLFIYGALLGGIFYVLFNALLQNNAGAQTVSYLAGAGPAVMAVVVATTILTPQYRLFPLLRGGMPVWVLTIIYVLATVLLYGKNNIDLLVAQAGGAVAGIIFILANKNGVDMGKWVNNFLDWVNNLFNPDKPKKGRNLKTELFYSADKPPYQRHEKPTEERIDAILDKINRTGYSSLTDVEKELLESAAENEV